jgi:hypothetical protein
LAKEMATVKATEKAKAKESLPRQVFVRKF